MIRKDCEQHRLQYYDIRPKKGGKEEVVRTMTGQPLHEHFIQNLNQQGEEVILQLMFNYLVLFGIILIPRMVL